MKKKLSILAVLVLAVTVSAYSVAGTYAKYTSNASFTDTARVAKWGIGLGTTNGNIDLFKDSYTNASSVVTASSEASGKDIVAPGTEGEYTFTTTGAPEVAYTLKLESTVTMDHALEGKVVFYIDTKDNAHKYTTAAQLQAALDALYDGTTVHAPGTTAASTHTIYWAWTFGESSAEDEADTALGNAAAAGSAATVDINFGFTATQVD